MSNMSKNLEHNAKCMASMIKTFNTQKILTPKISRPMITLQVTYTQHFYILCTIRGMGLYDLYCSLLSKVKETDGAIAATKGHKVRLVRVAVHTTKTNILACTVCVCVCVCVECICTCTLNVCIDYGPSYHNTCMCSQSVN